MGIKIYLTGAPASGKSTLSRQLQESAPGVTLFEYGHEMASYLRERTGRPQGDQETLRSGTDGRVTREDVRVVDDRMIERAESLGTAYALIIDTHQVTIEPYGFRIVPFDRDALTRLAPTEIWFMAVSPEETLRRISESAKGRPLPSLHQAALHTSLQLSLAVEYAAVLGVEMHAFDSDSGKTALDAATDRLRVLRGL